ncbi:hypothetical protein [Evansella halocellulosilytica]|uniref:hypothetical protein n=1 Tax=Evansella halocellulosilytica TaxID=2011013 RepID=UPI000BB67FDD|nr:hypothetical protein [Evansella halocellulosilytica]
MKKQDDTTVLNKQIKEQFEANVSSSKNQENENVHYKKRWFVGIIPYFIMILSAAILITYTLL